ncbi:MAG: HAMP domain-containing sensor histidine kinase [Pseudomonadota bacterium]
MFAVGALGIALFMASEEMEEALIEQIIDEEMSYVLERYAQHTDFNPQIGANLASYIVRTPAGESKLPPHLRGLGAGRHEIFRGAEEVHVAVRHIGETRFLVAYEVGLHEQREQEFKLLIVLALISVTGVALVLGYLLAGLLVKQITDLADRVNRLAPGATQDALTQPGQDEEVARLAHALDEYRARIAKMLRREQEFTANASHELRTPLTAISTSCELLAADPALGDKSSKRVALIARAAERMSKQIRMLLFLAREQETGAIEPVALAECVNDAAETCRDEMTRKALRLEIAVDKDVVLDFNRQALYLVLVNLIGNAVRHTEQGYIRVAYDGRQLSVADSGSGIAAEQLPHLFERFYRGDIGTDDGFGLGLAIVKRICDHYGWKIEVDSAPGRGSEFSIVFP